MNKPCLKDAFCTFTKMFTNSYCFFFNCIQMMPHISFSVCVMGKLKEIWCFIENIIITFWNAFIILSFPSSLHFVHSYTKSFLYCLRTRWRNRLPCYYDANGYTVTIHCCMMTTIKLLKWWIQSSSKFI